jgi:hypothetical protein
MRALLVVVIASCTTPPVVDVPDAAPPVPTDEAGEPLPSAGTATLRGGTIVLPAWMTKDAAVELSAVVFPAAGNDTLFELVRGNIIVSGTGDGFVRRVYAVEAQGGSIRVITSPATLADAVTDATFHMIANDPLWAPGHLDGRTESLFGSVDGELTFAPVIELDFALDTEGLRSFDLQVTGTGFASLHGTIDFTATTHLAWGEERDWKTPLFRRAYALGPLPLVVVGRLTTTLAASAYVDAAVSFTSGAEAELAIDATSSYTPAAGWTTTDASHVEVTQLGPVHGGAGRASLAIGIDPKVELAFYGEGGATLHLVVQAGAFGAYCGPSLITGLQTAVQGSVTYDLAPLVKSTLTYLTLWDKRQFLDELESCAP